MYLKRTPCLVCYKKKKNKKITKGEEYCWWFNYLGGKRCVKKQ